MMVRDSTSGTKGTNHQIHHCVECGTDIDDINRVPDALTCRACWDRNHEGLYPLPPVHVYCAACGQMSCHHTGLTRFSGTVSRLKGA